MWIGQACGNILTETGELMYYYVQGEMPEDDDKLVCQNWEDECEHEGTVAEFKAAAEASE